MRTIKKDGLVFVQTHEVDPESYDVKDEKGNVIAKVELLAGRLTYTFLDGGSSIVYSDNVDRARPHLHLIASAVNAGIAGCGDVNAEKHNGKKPLKAKVWKVFGYKGNDDCDGPADYNFSFEVVLDAGFSKEDVQDIFANRFSKKHRTVEVGATELREIEV